MKHNSQPSVGEVLDQILEILRNSELYSPADLQNKAQDPMVTDLIEGLVTVSIIVVVVLLLCFKEKLAFEICF